MVTSNSYYNAIESSQYRTWWWNWRRGSKRASIASAFRFCYMKCMRFLRLAPTWCRIKPRNQDVRTHVPMTHWRLLQRALHSVLIQLFAFIGVDKTIPRYREKEKSVSWMRQRFIVSNWDLPSGWLRWSKMDYQVATMHRIWMILVRRQCWWVS